MMKFRRLYEVPSGNPEPADASAAAKTCRPTAAPDASSDPGTGPKSSYAQSRKCRGCVYAGLFYQFERENIYYCDYLRRVGRKRPVSAEACRGWDKDGKYRTSGKAPDENS